LDSLSQPKPILDFLAIHRQQTCRKCGEFVDCVRLTKSPQRQGARLRFDDTTRSETCRECQIKAADDDEERDRLQADFDTMRAMRIELGLGDTAADIRVREALRIRGPRTTTLWVEQAPTSDPAVTADVYTVLCDGVGLPTVDDELEAWGATIATYPAVSLYFADPPDFPGVAFVALAVNIWHPELPGAVVRLRWSPSSPIDYAMSVASYGRFNTLNADERYQVITAASTVFDRWKPHPGGRRRGSTTWTREEFRDEVPRVRQKLRVRFGRKPTDREIAAEMGISKPSFDRYKRNFSRDAK
jgi:hypothetical protein